MFDSCLSPMLNFIKALHIGWFSDAFNSTAKDNPAVQSNTSKSNTAVRQSNTSIWPVQMPVLNTVRPFSTTSCGRDEERALKDMDYQEKVDAMNTGPKWGSSGDTEKAPVAFNKIFVNKEALDPEYDQLNSSRMRLLLDTAFPSILAKPIQMDEWNDLTKVDINLRVMSAIQGIISDKNISNFDKQVKIERLVYDTTEDFLKYTEQFNNAGPEAREYLMNVLNSLTERVKSVHYNILSDPVNVSEKDICFAFICMSLEEDKVATLLIGVLLDLNAYSKGQDRDSMYMTTFQHQVGRTILKRGVSQSIAKLGKASDNPEESFLKNMDKLPVSVKNVYFKDESNPNFDAGSIAIEIGWEFMEILSNEGLVSRKLDNSNPKRQEYYYEISNTFCTRANLKNTLSARTPSSLPMVHLPKRWKLDSDGKIKNHGGYLWNNVRGVQSLFYRKSAQAEAPRLLADYAGNNPLIDMINLMQNVPYKVNRFVLDFILQHNDKLNIFKPYSEDMTGTKFSRSKQYLKNKSEFDRTRDDFICLTTAITYSQSDGFYFPMRSDFRTRVYNECHAFTYQGTELAKALIEFAVPGKIYKDNENAIDTFNYFGAGLFSSNLDKASHDKRVQWVHENHENIMSFNTNFDFLNKADNKPMFLAWCHEYVQMCEWLNTDQFTPFHTRLPIQLDGTCNGLQHLNMFIRNLSNLKRLNLRKALKSDTPQDYYSYALREILGYIDDELSKNEAIGLEKDNDMLMYKRIKEFNLGRGNVKKALMTVSYNASNFNMTEYVVESILKDGAVEGLFGFVNGQYHRVTKLRNKKSDTEPTITTYRAVVEGKKYHFFDHIKGSDSAYTVNVGYENNGKVILQSDLYQFVVKFTTFFTKTTPGLMALKNYLNQLGKICGELNISPVWVLPSQVMVKAGYKKLETVKLPRAIGRTGTINVQRVSKLFDPVKTKVATMPNLVHSLDGCTVALLCKNLIKRIVTRDQEKVSPVKAVLLGLNNPNKIYSDNKERMPSDLYPCDINLYTIHDCFATTADNVDVLLDGIRKAYTEIYLDQDYLSEYHKINMDNLRKVLGSEAIDSDSKFITMADQQGKPVKRTKPNIKEVLRHSNVFKPDLLEGSQYILK